jgi:hypothetical protein
MTEQPALQAVDEHSNPTDLHAMEDAGVGFDPTTQHLDLTKDEKRRTTALMMAIQAYNHLIIKEAAYLTAAADLIRRNDGPALHPATIDAMVVAAFKFDRFIAGAYSASQPESDLEGLANQTGFAEPE